jgi:hypothetical protein
MVSVGSALPFGCRFDGRQAVAAIGGVTAVAMAQTKAASSRAMATTLPFRVAAGNSAEWRQLAT